MSLKIDLNELYSRVMPYLSEPVNIKSFLESLNKDVIDREELIERIEKSLKDAEGTLKTDFRIILNTINQI